MMKIYEGPRLSPEQPCPYLENRQARYEFMFAHQVNADEWTDLLEQGWRHFGLYFFRPQCIGCTECRPIRVRLKEFRASKSQRRVLNKNKDIDFRIGPKVFRPEIFDLYQKHTRLRFKGQYNPNETEEDFWINHYPPTVEGLQSEFYLDNKLVALGLLDIGRSNLSSSYFIYDPEYTKRSLGKLGALLEIEWAKQKGMDFYYLGHWIENNDSMNYKSQFRPFELYDWHQKKWE